MSNVTKTVKSSGGDYTSLNAALAGQSADLTANCGGSGGAGILTIECYSMEDTTIASTGTGYTTSSSYYINITVPASEVHDGKWNTSKYRLVSSSSPVISNQEEYTRITGVQAYSSSGVVILSTAAGCLIDRCIVSSTATSTSQHAIYSNVTGDPAMTIRNSLVYGPASRGIYAAQGTVTCQNVTAVDCGRQGFYATGGGTITCVNCIGWSNGDGSTYLDFGAGGTITCNNCLSYDTSADNFGGSGNVADSTDNPFADYDNDDFHLVVGCDAINAGQSLAGTFTTDIDGETRTGTWDIGADEYVAAASGVPLSNPFSRPFRQAFGRGGF